MQRKLNIFLKKFDNVRFCVRPLCEAATALRCSANDVRQHHCMAISLLHFTDFFKGEDNYGGRFVSLLCNQTE